MALKGRRALQQVRGCSSVGRGQGRSACLSSATDFCHGRKECWAAWRNIPVRALGNRAAYGKGFMPDFLPEDRRLKDSVLTIARQEGSRTPAEMGGWHWTKTC